MTHQYRTWRERLHDLNCPECWPKVAHRRRMRELLTVVYLEPTQAEIDSWFIPEDGAEDADA